MYRRGRLNECEKAFWKVSHAVEAHQKEDEADIKERNYVMLGRERARGKRDRDW